MDVRSLNHLDYDELQAQLQERGLNTSGKKFTLVERLSAALQAEERHDGDAVEESTATCDPYLDPYFFAGPQDPEHKMHRRSRSRSPRKVSSEKAKAQGLRRLAEDICGVGLQASLASLDAAVAAGSVSTKLLTELEAKLSTCITMIEMQQK
ncbi:unnamed protein product [Symbiodinium natans]|uniref:SAP domain-containing protein n=1 Tax=Symbiodinium natans TaxID=878477 RepID=A0A812V4R8_9DINO|nr:unnamed protein product [Symbiodinium natans]